MGEVKQFTLIAAPEPLRCTGASRVGANPQALIFFFNRPPTDDEMRFLHEVMQRSAVMVGAL